MPAIMIMAVVGSILKVSGRSRAIVAGGPRPGSTPTIVPKNTPTKHQKRFAGLRAIENPRKRLPIASKSPPISSKTPRPSGERNAQGNGEYKVKPQGKTQGYTNC